MGRDWKPGDVDEAFFVRMRDHLANECDWFGMFEDNTVECLVAAFEAAQNPPKPEEPTGLGAVVEDAEGRRYVRHCPGDCEDGNLCIPWHRVVDAMNRTYDEFDAVRVLSEGVDQ